MKLGLLGLYRHLLNSDHYQFAVQAGATHIVAHLCDYFAHGRRDGQPTGDGGSWGLAGSPLWTVDELIALRRRSKRGGLGGTEAIENPSTPLTGMTCCSMVREKTLNSKTSR